MPLLAVVETIESVPEAIRGDYAKGDDGKFYLNLEGGDALPFVANLKTALASERGLNKTAKDKVAAWERLGVSPEEIETRLADERKKAEDAALKAGKFDEVLSTHLGNAKKERDTAVGVAETKANSALGIARNALIGSNLGAALTKAKATSEGIKALPTLIGNRVKIDFDENGNATSSILDPDGKTPMVGSGPQGLATYDDLVKDAMKEYPSLFEGAGGGSGSDPKGQRRDAGGKTLTLTEFHALGPMDRAAKIKEGFKVVD